MATPFGSSGLISATYTSGSPVAITVSPGTIETALGSVYSVGFVQSAQAAMAGYALAVLGEDGSLANASARKDYARLVLSNPTTYTANAIWAITADGATGDVSTDQQLYNRIVGIWDLLSYGA